MKPEDSAAALGNREGMTLVRVTVCDSGRDDNSACVTAGGMTIVCV